MKTMFNLDIARALKAGDGANSNPCIPVPKEKNIWEASLFVNSYSTLPGTYPGFGDTWDNTGTADFGKESILDAPFSRYGGGLSGTIVTRNPMSAPYDGTVYRVDIPYKYKIVNPQVKHSNPSVSASQDSYKKVKRQKYNLNNEPIEGLIQTVEIPVNDNWLTWNQWFDMSELSDKVFYIPHIILVSDEAKYGKNNDNYLVTVLSGSRNEYFYPKERKVKRGQLIMGVGNMFNSVQSMIDNYLTFLPTAGYVLTHKDLWYQKKTYKDDKGFWVTEDMKKDMRVMTESNMGKYLKLSNIYDPYMFTKTTGGIFNELSIINPISSTYKPAPNFRPFTQVDAFGTPIPQGEVNSKDVSYTPFPASPWLSMESAVRPIYYDNTDTLSHAPSSYVPIMGQQTINGKVVDTNLSPVGILYDMRITSSGYLPPGGSGSDGLYSAFSSSYSGAMENIGVVNSELYDKKWLVQENEWSQPSCSLIQNRATSGVLLGTMEFRTKITSGKDFLRFQNTSDYMGGNNVEAYPEVRFLRPSDDSMLTKPTGEIYFTGARKSVMLEKQMDYGTNIRFLFRSDVPQMVENVPKTLSMSGGLDYFSGYQTESDFSDKRMGYIFNYLPVGSFAYFSGLLQAGELELSDGEDIVHRKFENGGRTNYYNIKLSHDIAPPSGDFYIETAPKKLLLGYYGAYGEYGAAGALFPLNSPNGFSNVAMSCESSSPSVTIQYDTYKQLLIPYPPDTYIEIPKERINLRLARYNGKEKPRKELIEIDETFSDPMGWLLPMSL